MDKVETDVYEIRIYKEFMRLLCEMYLITENQARDWIVGCGEMHQWNNGHAIIADVSKSEFIEYDQWLRENAPPNQDFIDSGIETLLCDAANRNLIPEGKYIVHYSW